MNRLGMLVDLSHVSDSTFFDAVAVSSVPVIASHSSARALSDFPRNLSDEQLRAVARNGGVVNVNFFSRFLDSDVSRARRGGRGADRRRRGVRCAPGPTARPPPPSSSARCGIRCSPRCQQTPFAVLIDHIDHMARVAGVDHVGIGSDFDGVSALPAGMEDVTRLPRIAQASARPRLFGERRGEDARRQHAARHGACARRSVASLSPRCANARRAARLRAALLPSGKTPVSERGRSSCRSCTGCHPRATR